MLSLDARLHFLAIDGDSTWVARGHIAESGPIHKMPFVYVSAQTTSADAALGLAAQNKAEQYAAVTESISDYDGRLIRWRRGEIEPEGNYDVLSVPEGNLMVTDAQVFHIPPPNQVAGRTLLYYL
ncbi:hypothetical protein EKI60_00625 [Candidatus Saccharibacteria bacterium]|nr:MAG: hypothetical protein EKI60_00625 [Candidatus Saccharibacteria bacterium]